MEISKYIKDALKDGSIDKVSKGIEQLVMMMINAIGMIERRELEFEQHLQTLDEDIEIIKSFLLSTPTSVPTSPQPPSLTPSTDQIHSPQISLPSPTPATPAHQTSISPPRPPQGPAAPTSEEDILAFRKKLLKPAPKHDKPKPQPISIRAALMQEMKEYFGSAMSKVEKEKKDAD